VLDGAKSKLNALDKALCVTHRNLGRVVLLFCRRWAQEGYTDHRPGRPLDERRDLLEGPGFLRPISIEHVYSVHLGHNVASDNTTVLRRAVLQDGGHIQNARARIGLELYTNACVSISGRF